VADLDGQLTVAEPTPPPTDLAIFLLGPLRAERSGAPLTLGGRRQKAVLARLAVVAGQVVSVDRLIDDLWAGEPPASAGNTLQSYVSNLRRILGGGGPAIERVGDGYRLAPESATVDAARFEALVAAATSPGAGLAVGERIARLDEGLALWHGRAVADFADEAWAQGEAVRLDELRLAATEERFALQLEAGQHGVIVGELTAAVAEHPLRERLTALLVLALYRCGRQAEALRAYERTRAHLADELGLDPGPDLVALADRVLAHDPSLAAPEPGPSAEHRSTDAPAGASNAGGAAEATGGAAAPAGAGERGPIPVVPPPTGPLELPPAVAERRNRSPFVGRDAELATLARALDAVEAGDRRMVTIAGEPGMGKTRLAQVFATVAHDQGAHVLWGRCTAENLIAYQPAVEALRTALRSVSERRLRAMVEPRPALGLLLPDGGVGGDPRRLDGAGADGPGPEPSRSPSRAERYELYESLADLVGEVAGSAPIVFVVDDIQWADRSTLALVEHLLRQERTGRLLVVATIRRPAGRATTELDALVSDLRRNGRLDPIELAGMADDDVARLLGEHGIDLPPEQAAAVRDRTGGNPFFVESLAEQGGDLLHLTARDLPDSVRDVIDLRVAGLDPEVARVLTAGAVIGLRVELDLLGAVTGRDADALLDTLDVAIEAGLLAEDEDIGWVTFPHALVRQALIARTTRNREAQLHLQIADALATRPATLDQASTMAQHLVRAGRLCPPARAAAAAIDAGRRAMAVLADDEARTWGRRALDAMAAADPDDPEVRPLRIEAQLLVAEASRHLGDLVVARSALDLVIAEARARGDAASFARAVQERELIIAGVGFAFGTVDEELLALLGEAIVAVEGSTDLDPAMRDRYLASLTAWSSIGRTSAPDKPRQRALADQALVLAERCGEAPDLLALALLAQRLAHADPAGLDLRREVGPRMHRAAMDAGWTELVVVGMVLDVVDLLESAQLQAALDRIDELEVYVIPFHRPVYDAYHLFLAAAVTQMAGRHADAEELSARADVLGEVSHADNARHARAGQQYMMARDLGFLAELVPLTEAMVAAYPGLPVWLTAHASCCVAAGRLEEAQATIDAMFASDGLEVRDSTWSTTVAQLAEVCWLLGDREHSAALAEMLEPIADRMAVTGMGAVCLGFLHRPRGLALAGAGDRDGAIAELTLAIDRSEELGIDLWLARACAERALLCAERGAPGDAERVAEDRRRAGELAHELGVRLALGPTEYPLDAPAAVDAGR
jgi:DNA-binding SARP family transcriptional activator